MKEVYSKINWVLVYISEAHAIDEWPIMSSRYTPDSKPVNVKQSETIEEREKLCKRFINEYGFKGWNSVITLPCEYNNVFDNFETNYKPWPFRIYGFKKNILSFISEPRSCETRIEELTYWINSLESEY